MEVEPQSIPIPASDEPDVFEMSEEYVALKFLVENYPEDPYTPVRQEVLDNWPNIKPVFSPKSSRVAQNKLATDNTK
jgi:hypothetical protein